MPCLDAIPLIDRRYFLPASQQQRARQHYSGHRERRLVQGGSARTLRRAAERRVLNVHCSSFAAVFRERGRHRRQGKVRTSVRTRVVALGAAC